MPADLIRWSSGPTRKVRLFARSQTARSHVVFASGGGTPVMCTFGQFASVILEALARLPLAGGPAAGRFLGSHRCTTIFLRRVWSTALAIVGRMNESNKLVFWSLAQRGPFVVRLAALRKTATPAELNAFYLMDADLELVGVDPAASVQPESAGMPMWWRNAEWQLGGLADEERGTLSRSRHAASITAMAVSTSLRGLAARRTRVRSLSL